MVITAKYDKGHILVKEFGRFLRDYGDGGDLWGITFCNILHVSLIDSAVAELYREPVLGIWLFSRGLWGRGRPVGVTFYNILLVSSSDSAIAELYREPVLGIWSLSWGPWGRGRPVGGLLFTTFSASVRVILR